MMTQKKIKLLLSLLAITSTLGISACNKSEQEPNSGNSAQPVSESNTNSDNEISSNAVYVVNGGSSSISVIDMVKNEVIKTIKLDNVAFPHHISINKAQDKVALGVPGMDFSGGHEGMMAGMSGKVVVLDAKTGKQLAAADTPEMNHNSIFSPDQKEIWTAEMAGAGRVLVYDANTLKIIKEIPAGKNPAEVTFSADGTKAFVANDGSNDITVINIADKKVIKTIPVGENPVGAWTGADNKMYVDNEHGKTISIIDVNKLVVEETVDLGFTPGMASFNLPMGELWVSDADSGSVVFFKKEKGKFIKAGNISTGKGAHAIGFSKDGKIAYITNQLANNVSVIDVAKKVKVKDIKVDNKPNGILIREIS